MSDYNSSLPVRTENNGDIVAKIGDGTTPSQQLAVDSSGRITAKLADGSGNAVTSQVNGAQRALDVGINVAGVQIDPRSIRALTSSDVVTAAQGSANSTANAWPIKLTDGTNVTAVKAASTAAAAADPSVVVAFSPNSPLPTGANTIGSVNQGTSPWVTKDQADGPVTPGAVASFSQLVGGQYNTALPTLTTGQQSAIQIDSSGRLIVISASSDDHNYGTVGATTSRSAAQIGNATGAADFNAGATGAQTLRVVANQGAANATPWNENIAQFGGSSVTLGQKVMASSMPVTIASDQSAIPITAASLPLPTGAATEATLAKLPLAQGSTTSGQSGPLVQGAVTTAAPAYTTAQTSPLSLNTSGGLRVDGSGVTQPISAAALPLPSGASTSALQSSVQGSVAGGTAATSSQLSGLVFNTAPPSLTNGQQASLQGDSAANLKVNLITALPTGANTIGNIGTVTAVTAITNALPAGANAIGSVLANLQVSSAAVSVSNPVPVSISSTIPGTAIQNYNTVASVAAAATSNHDYTVTAGKTLNLQRVWASGSGKLKVEVQVETGVATGVFTSKFVGFNSTATPNIDITVVSSLAVAAGVRVRVIRTNKDNQSQDVYTTIEGTEV